MQLSLARDDQRVDEERLKSVLVTLYDKFLQGNPKKHDQFELFISYGWVTKVDPSQWKNFDVVNDLIRLADLLKAAWHGRARGFKVLLDINSNRPDGSLNEYIDKIVTADAVLCILTPVYKTKFENSKCALNKEKLLLEERRKIQGSKDEDSRIYPWIWVCDGTDIGEHIAACRPESWDSRNFTTRSIVNQSFLSKLKIILKELLIPRLSDGFDTKKSQKFERIWNSMYQNSSIIQSLRTSQEKISSHEISPDSVAPLKPFMEAAKDGDIGAIYQHLNMNNQLIYDRDVDGWSALHHAASNGRKDAVTMLLAHEINVDIECTNAHHSGWTPLCSAVWNGHREVITSLLKEGADPKIRVKGAFNGLGIFDLAQAALRDAELQHPESVERLRDLSEYLHSQVTGLKKCHDEIPLTPNSEFICLDNGYINVNAELRGIQGHWHVTGFINGARKEYFMLLHPKRRRPVDVGAQESGHFTLVVNKGDKVLISASANVNDVLERDLNFRAIFHPVQYDLSLPSLSVTDYDPSTLARK